MLDRRSFALISLSSLGILLASGAFNVAAAVGARPSGDAATIAYYHQIVAAYRPIRSVSGVRRGFFSYTVSGPVFAYRYGEAPPAGFRPAVESLRYALRNGRITRFVDIAKAPGLPSLTIVQDASGVLGTRIRTVLLEDTRRRLVRRKRRRSRSREGLLSYRARAWNEGVAAVSGVRARALVSVRPTV